MAPVQIPSHLARCLINGQRVKTSKTFKLTNPTTNEVTTEVFEAGADEINKAVQAAKAAQAEWEFTSGQTRAAAMNKWAALVQQNHSKLAEIEASVLGRPVRHYIDAHVFAGCMEYIAGLASNSQGRTSLNNPGMLAMSLRQPYGVTCGIIPFNAPTIMVGMKAGPAVGAGNAIIIKTSEKAPITPSLVIDLAEEAGFPKGLIQCVHGSGETGKLLAEHNEIRKISFTGSGNVGRKIMTAAANSNFKAVTIELGGKNPLIVFDDADMQEAVAAAAFSIAWNSGQVCMSSTRLYVHEKIYDQFCEKFAQELQKYKHGDPSLPETMMGPQADAAQAKTVQKYLDIAAKEGKVLVGGKPGDGNFINLTVLTDVADEATINKEEIFGPVVVVHKFTDEADVIRRANDTDYGLYASVFTQNVDRALRLSRRLEAGTVGVNITSPFHAPDMPFGGFKQSGVGRELGADCLNAWTEEKTVYMKAKGF